MKSALKFNRLWAVVLMVLHGIWSFGTFPRVYIFFASIIYGIISIRAYKLERWAIAAVLIFVTICMLKWLPMVAINFYMFYAGSELYRDSPATILVVGVYAFLFAAPSSILFLWFVCCYKALISILVGEECAKGFKDGWLAALLVFAFFLSVLYVLVFEYYQQYNHAVEIDAQWLVSRHSDVEEEALDAGEFQ